ncbi:MAG: cytochrome c [Nitrospirae bacterium]|nr:cytochrome c [Nitrospirota bacterium]
MKRIMGWAVGAAVLIAIGVFVVRVVFEDPHVAKGRAIFSQYCTGCHGDKGRGDGFNAHNLDPGPRDLTDRVEAFMADSTNEDLFKGIREGVSGNFPVAAGEKAAHPKKEVKKGEAAKKGEEDEAGGSPLMPYWGYTLSEEQIWDLVAYIRTLHKNSADKIKFKEAAGEEKKPSVSRPQPVTFPDLNSAEGQKMAVEGQGLYETKYSCTGCHRIGEKGGQIGPELSRAGFRMNAAWMYQWIQYPQAIRHDTKMPAFNMPEVDAKPVVMYLKTLRATAAESPGPPSGKGPT